MKSLTLSTEKTILSSNYLVIPFIITLIFFIFLAIVQVHYWPQFYVAWGLILVLYFLYLLNSDKSIVRLLILSISSYIVLRYVFWRTFYTISFNDPFSFLASISLYLAELYAIIIFFLGVIVNISPLKRKPPKLPEDEAKLPTVDILIPTYNESAELLEQTIICATNIIYPKDKLKIYLLDDGATEEKLNHPDPEVSRKAKERFKELNELAKEYNINYINRKKNEHAKAGNINYALHHTSGDLILILDADHAPTRDILQKTVGFFLEDEKLFLVQTPHFFINPDPIEKNLRIFGKIPSENEMFYFNIQYGLDFWNASFFCGSAALLRRSYLMEIGGISGLTITEDAETALELHSRGYNSAYLGYPMISGLQPQTFTDLINQRIRWSQGMTQILLLKNPLLKKGLNFFQKLSYLNSSFFWLFSLPRLIFLFAPSMYLLFGLYIYRASIYEFFGYAFPCLISVIITSNYLHGRTRKFLISELYELMQAFFLLPALFKVLKSPSSPKFKVTPKIADLRRDFISELSIPFYIAYVVLVLSLFASIYRYINHPMELWTIIVTLIWTVINIILLNGAIGALYERRQLRAQPRVPADIPVKLILPDTKDEIQGKIVDISTSGCMVLIDLMDYEKIKNYIDILNLYVYSGEIYNKPCTLKIKIVYHNIHSFKGRIGLGIKFILESKEEKVCATLLTLSDSKRWEKIVQTREHPTDLISSFTLITSIGFKESALHVYKLLLEIKKRIEIILYLFKKKIKNKKVTVLNYITKQIGGQ